MTTPTNSDKAWTNKGGHVKPSTNIFAIRLGANILRPAI